MKSVGEVLKEARQQKKFTLDDVHKFIKVHPKFLKALEEGDYSVFSNKIHAKGFLKNYAEFLELNVDELLAFWRREYEIQFDKEQKKVPDKFKLKKLDPPKLILTPGLILTVTVTLFVVGFLGYLFYQYRNYSGAPDLKIYHPQDTFSNTEILDITGKTDIDSVLLINNQRVILGNDGTFATSLRLQPGLNTLSFLAVNKLGKETEEIRTIIYREPEQENNSANESSASEDLDALFEATAPSKTMDVEGINTKHGQPAKVDEENSRLNQNP